MAAFSVAIMLICEVEAWGELERRTDELVEAIAKANACRKNGWKVQGWPLSCWSRYVSTQHPPETGYNGDKTEAKIRAASASTI